MLAPNILEDNSLLFENNKKCVMSSYKNNRLAPSPKYLAKCPPMYAIHLKATQSPEEKSIFLKLEGDKTDDQKNREEMLLAQLMTLVKQRDQLVQIEDTQVQQRYVLLNLLKYLMVQIGLWIHLLYTILKDTVQAH